MNLQGHLNFDGPIITDPLEPRSSYRPSRPAQKIVRRVCREQNNRLRDEAKQDRAAGRETKLQKVARCMAAFENYYQTAPTPAELTHYMFTRGEIPADRVNLIAPRISEGINGETRKLDDGTVIRKGGGLFESLPLRQCRITGTQAHPVRTRVLGTKG